MRVAFANAKTTPIFLTKILAYMLYIAHLELCSRSAYAMVCTPHFFFSLPKIEWLKAIFFFASKNWKIEDWKQSSLRRPSLAFHIFDISSRTISWIEVKLSRRHCSNINSELLISFRSDIQDGRHGGHLEILKTLPPKPKVQLGWNLVRGIVATWRFRIAKIVPFRCPRWPQWRPSWNSSNDIFSQTRSPIELKLDGWHHSDTEIQKC